MQTVDVLSASCIDFCKKWGLDMRGMRFARDVRRQLETAFEARPRSEGGAEAGARVPNDEREPAPAAGPRDASPAANGDRRKRGRDALRDDDGGMWGHDRGHRRGSPDIGKRDREDARRAHDRKRARDWDAAPRKGARQELTSERERLDTLRRALTVGFANRCAAACNCACSAIGPTSEKRSNALRIRTLKRCTTVCV